jgi:hypothetical protein
VPIVASPKLVENETLRVYEGAPHLRADTRKHRIYDSLLASPRG